MVRIKARGLPSVASPFSGMNVHRTFVLVRFTRVTALTGCFFSALLGAFALEVHKQ